MSTDKYSFDKSSTTQHQSNTPYESKQWNYINSLNNGNYQNNSLSLCQIDLGSIFNSKYFVSLEDAFIAVPLVMVYAMNTGAVSSPPLVAGGAGCPSAAIALKNSYTCIVDKLEFELDGVIIEQMNPFANIVGAIRLISSMSIGDLIQYGSEIGLPMLDSVNSMKYNTLTGLQNNYVFGNSMQANAGAVLNSGCTNDRITKAIQRIGWTATGASSNNFDLLQSQTQIDQEGKASFRIQGTNYGVIYDTAIIRLKDVLDSFANIPLCRKLGAGGALRIYFNTGSVSVLQGSSTSIGQITTAFSQSNSTFSTTCPITFNQSSNPITATAFTNISAGLFIGKAPTTSIGVNSVNLGLSGASHPTINDVRFYYSMVELKPQKALEYVSANRSKLITYNSYLTTVINNVPAGSSYSSIIQSGLTNIKGIFLIPLIGSSINNYSQYQSPVDTCGGCTFSPLSLSSLSVQIGGVNVLNVPLYYSWENYVEQVSQIENIITDFGLPVGLMTEDYWQNSRVYYVDASRYNLADGNTPRNIVVQFINNNSVSLDCLVFCVKGDQFLLDVETGSVKK